MDSTTITQDENNLPWYRKVKQEQRDFMRHYKGKDRYTVVQDMFLPAMYRLHEIIHTDETPPQVRLQASQVIINKVIGDKIDIKEQKVTLDVNKLLDQLSGIKSITTEVIDITNDSI